MTRALRARASAPATFYTSKTTGLFASGIGFTIGQEKLATTDTTAVTTAAPTMVGATSGDVTIAANDNVAITGSQVIAGGGGDVSLTGNNVTITAAQDTSSETQTYKQSSSGLSIGLSGGILSASEAVVADAQAASGSSDSRVQALQGIAAAANAVTGVAEAIGTPGVPSSSPKNDVPATGIDQGLTALVNGVL